MPKTSVFLVDDHEMLRAGVQILIDQESDMQVVGGASDAQTALEQIEQVQPAIIVMDVSMPGISGIEATGQVRSRWPHIQVVALTRHAEPGFVRQILQAGARGYVLKQAPSHELITAIRTVAANRMFLDSTLTKHAAELFVQMNNPSKGFAASELSEREAEVVRLIAQGYGNKEAAVQLGISVKTVDTYKARAMEKLGLYSRAELVRYALHQGWFDQE